MNVLTIVMDILWCFTMSSVWAGKPAKNPNDWMAFARIRAFTMFLSSVNVVLKAVATVFLVHIYRGGRNGAGAQPVY